MTKTMNTSTTKERNYWSIQLTMAENHLKGCQSRYRLNPNPWNKTMLEFAEDREKECCYDQSKLTLNKFH